MKVFTEMFVLQILLRLDIRWDPVTSMLAIIKADVIIFGSIVCIHIK